MESSRGKNIFRNVAPAILSNAACFWFLLSMEYLWATEQEVRR